MNLCIIESKDNEIRMSDDMIFINVKNINVLKNMDYKSLFEFMFEENKLVQNFTFIKHIKDSVMKCIFNELSIEEFRSELEDKEILIFSIIINLASYYKRMYNNLISNKIDDIYIECNKDSFLDTISLFRIYDVPCSIKCRNTSLKEFSNLLENVCLDNLNIYIDYQEENTPIEVSKLYDLSLIVKDIVEDINKYNLSDLEKIMYVYDFVKYRVYNKDEDDLLNNRDLDRVINGDKIVCSGYSNLFNAILNSLDIKTMPIVSLEAKHQRSIVYVKDDKYDIDGIYAFDPTWDCRREEDDDYIDKYNYFMMPLSRAKITAYDNVSKLLDVNLDEVFNSFNCFDTTSKDTADRYFTVISELENLFSFAEIGLFSDYYDKEGNEDSIKKCHPILVNKCNAKEMDCVLFFKLLYMVRRIEYYNGIIDDIDIDSLIDALKIRYINIIKMENRNMSKFDLIMKVLPIDSMVDKKIVKNDSLLNDGIVSCGIDRDINNIRLVKTLKRVLDDKKKV